MITSYFSSDWLSYTAGERNLGDGMRVGKERKKGEKQNGDIAEGRKKVPEMQCLFTALPRTQVGLFHQHQPVGH